MLVRLGETSPLQQLKPFVRDLVPPILYRFFKLKLRRYYAKDDLDRKLEKYLDYNDGYYVELGANDGIGQTNTYYFEKSRNWKGVLIEPAPQNFLKCRENRSKRNRFFCAACVSFDYKEAFVKIVYSNLMSTSVGLESEVADSAAHAKSGTAFLPPNEEIFEFGALARTLNSLLVQAKAPALMDLLSLDVEGAELEVLKGINHHDFKFKYICVECLGNPDGLKSYLSANGYSLVEKLSEVDYLFRLNSPSDK